ncbi:MAG: hypothetical protein MUQ30_13425 [Anaerolineae bacterium]|nr:hypothetical protein [Anaerolineae bacterium]
MQNQKRKSITSGLLLILIGLVFLTFQVFPNLRMWADQEFTWPVSILLVAVGLLVIGALTGTADMLVPASIVGGIGGILYFQNAGILTWESWAFLWTLIPGFVGVGIFLSGLLKWNRKEMGDGLQSLLVSAVLFLVFGSLIGSVFGYVPFTDYLPILLIVLGAYLFVRAILKGTRA